MAKKLTARQRKARKRASYYKYEYNKTVDAIRFIQRFGVDMDIPIIKEPKKITKTSLKTVREIYKKTRRQIERTFSDYEFVDEYTGEVYQKLPTKKEAAKAYREEQREGVTPFDPYDNYFTELKERIDSITPRRDSDKTEENYQRNVVPIQDKIKTNFKQAIDDAIAKYGEERIANRLAGNQYMQRIANLDEKYTYEIVEDISNGDLFTLFDASVSDALTLRTSYYE